MKFEGYTNMILYVVTVIQKDRIEEQTVYTDIDKAIQHIIYEMHQIAEKTDISYKRVKELEQKMWQSLREPDPSYRYTFSYYDIYIKMFTIN